MTAPAFWLILKCFKSEDFMLPQKNTCHCHVPKSSFSLLISFGIGHLELSLTGSTVNIQLYPAMIINNKEEKVVA